MKKRFIGMYSALAVLFVVASFLFIILDRRNNQEIFLLLAILSFLAGIMFVVAAIGLINSK